MLCVTHSGCVSECVCIVLPLCATRIMYLLHTKNVAKQYIFIGIARAYAFVHWKWTVHHPSFFIAWLLVSRIRLLILSLPFSQLHTFNVSVLSFAFGFFFIRNEKWITLHELIFRVGNKCELKTHKKWRFHFADPKNKLMITMMILSVFLSEVLQIPKKKNETPNCKTKIYHLNTSKTKYAWVIWNDCFICIAKHETCWFKLELSQHWFPNKKILYIEIRFDMYIEYFLGI